MSDQLNQPSQSPSASPQSPERQPSGASVLQEQGAELIHRAVETQKNEPDEQGGSHGGGTTQKNPSSTQIAPSIDAPRPIPEDPEVLTKVTKSLIEEQIQRLEVLRVRVKNGHHPDKAFFLAQVIGRLRGYSVSLSSLTNMSVTLIRDLYLKLTRQKSEADSPRGEGSA